MASKEEVEAIRVRANNALTRRFSVVGVKLTWDQLDAVGVQARDWLRTALDLRATLEDDGIAYAPRIDVGDRVEAVELADSGRVTAINEDLVTVRWDSGALSSAPLAVLRRIHLAR